MTAQTLDRRSRPVMERKMEKSQEQNFRVYLAERIERLQPDRMVGEKGTTFLYSEDVTAIVEALRSQPSQKEG